MTIVAIVLAAGEGRRMGGPKALLRLGEETFLARCTRLFTGCGVAPVVAVLGASAEVVRAEAGLPEDTVIVVNEDWRSGMLSSVLAGLDAAESLGAEAVLLHPVDHPLVGAETVDRLVRALAAGAFIAVPTHAGRRGHPGGFSHEAFAALRAAPPEVGARAVLRDHAARVRLVEGGPGCLLGVDTPDDLARAAALV
jgi:nicotine blue oxidoreductase